MKQLTWLHLSDWHQQGSEFDRNVVRDALIRDIRERKRIDAALEQVDFVVFSGDLAFSGIPAEYEAARRHLLDPLMDAVGVEHTRLFMVPGNHDLNRYTVTEMLPTELQKPLDSDALVQKWLHASKRARTLEPFDAYREFVAEYTKQPTPDFASIVHLDSGGKRIALLGLNSAWMNARNRDAQGDVNDYGYTLVGEPQIHGALAQIADADLRIAVVHHPCDWLSEFDRNRIEGRLCRECHFILRGHVHSPQVLVIRGTAGDCVIIPAGASYQRRLAQDPRYTNAYNLVHLDFDAGKGAIYLRRWSDQRNEWIEDIDTHAGGKFALDTLPKAPGSSSPSSSVPATPAPVVSARPAFERECSVLEGYLSALIRNNTDLEPGGIKQTKVQVVVPLDEIYVGLHADHDRPDVDRRVMHEELDEINRNLELEEDPKKREKQYQIWAHHWRVIQEALEISSSREDLSNIVQRHRQVVILGDPGSGKTTLVRYLALRLARAIMAEPGRLFQPQELWDERAVWTLPDLGSVRLPILLRISHYADARQKDPDLAFVDYLPRYFAGLSVPNADELGPLLQRLLDEGRCMVLLDGLDEIIDPTDRRNIAAAIGQFAGVYRETGLPDWLARSTAFSPASVNEKSEAQSDGEDEGDDTSIQWDRNVPEDVRQEWGKQIKRQKARRRPGRAVRLAWELLDGARYAHVGNRFVVTSRIAGYHFAGVPGEFEHFTIRRMSLDDIKLFLERWCPAVERRVAASPDPVQVEQRARREIEGIMKAIATTPGVRRMAENPLLLRILAIIHRNEAHLPQRRVELYETASVTLLRDWHLERGTKGAAIDDVKATSLLGPLAFHIHENRASGFLSKGETERILARILARERGEGDLEQPSLETRESVHRFLETVREHSGLFVERGEGLYGFMHLTFEEYFTARQLVSSATKARTQILERLHLPRWHEPILLAVGSLSKQFYDDTHDLLRAILEAGSTYEAMLHRDLLFAAACVGDSVNVAPVLRQEIAGRLLTLYCNRGGSGRFRLLQQQVKDALVTLCNDQGDAAVEAALAETLRGCADQAALTCAFDVVDWLRARTPAVADALLACSELGALPRAQEVLHGVQSRLPASGSGARVVPEGWNAVCDDPGLARLLGAMSRYGASEFLVSSLGIPKDIVDIAKRELRLVFQYHAVESARSLIQRFDETPIEQRDVGFWNAIAEALQDIWRGAPARSEMEAAAEGLIGAVAVSLEKREDTREAARSLRDFLMTRKEQYRQAETVAPRVSSLDQALAQFRSIAGQQEGALADVDFDLAFQSAGAQLLKAASAGHTLAATFAAAAGGFGSLRLRPNEETLRARVQTLHLGIARALLALLRSAANGQQYQEAARYLASREPRSLSDHESKARRLSAEAAEILSTDLEGANATRRIWALQALTSPAVREHVTFTDARRKLLLSLLNAPAVQARMVMDILFVLDVDSELLSWCWSVLRSAGHLLADVVVEKLDGIKAVNGDLQTLARLDEGLRDHALRSISLELLLKVKWQGLDTFAQSLMWLSGEDAEVRDLAALLLATQDDLLSVPRAVLVSAAQERLTTTTSSLTALREDPRLVRLLGGLWIHGWDDALTQLWVAQPAVPYVDKHPARYWRSFRTYPGNEECIRWLLGKAAFGHHLIATFQNAAAHLAELEGQATQAEPNAEHIACIQQEILGQIDSLLRDPITVPLLRVDAAVLAAAIRKGAIPTVATEAVQAALAVTDGSARLTTSSRLTEQAGFRSWLRAQCMPDSIHPMAVWLRGTLALNELTPESPAAALVQLLRAADADIRAAASLSLLAADLPSLLVNALAEASQSANDQVRMRGVQRLYKVCDNVPTDGSTSAVETLQRFQYDAVARRDGHLGTVSSSAVGRVIHSHPFWAVRWLDAIGKNAQADKSARQALSGVRKVSAEVRSYFSAAMNDSTRPIATRRVAANTLREILRHDQAVRTDDSIQTALTTALEDPDTDCRRSAAYALQWAAGRDLRSVIEALLRAAETDHDDQVRTLSLRSLGCVVHAVRVRDGDASKEALFRWLNARTKDDWQLLEVGGALPSALGIKEASNAQAVLAALSCTGIPGLPEDVAVRRDVSEKWQALVQGARQEWEARRYYLETLPILAPAIAQIEGVLNAPSRAIAGSAACALARLYHGDDDLPIRLQDLLNDDRHVLRAMLDAATDENSWGDEGETGASHHPWAVKQIVGWMEARLPEERARLVDSMLDDLENEMEGMGVQEQEDGRLSDPFGGWPARRISMAVLFELSERLTYRVFVRTRDITNVVTLFIRAASDPESYNTRRFAIGALGNLQQLNDQVADVFFAACQDVGEVYKETRIAVKKFRVFGPGSLERLTAAIRSPSVTVAHHAALLLGELGVSRSEDLGREGRQRVADVLVQLLDDPVAKRTVYDFSKGANGERVGPLYDVIYEALVRVVSGPDAPESAAAPVQ